LCISLKIPNREYCLQNEIKRTGKFSVTEVTTKLKKLHSCYTAD